MKICTKCKVEKEITEFSLPNSWCKACFNEYSKAYRQENRDKIAAYGKTYRDEHKEEISEYGAEYYQENKEHIQKRKRSNAIKNKEAYSETTRAYNNNEENRKRKRSNENKRSRDRRKSDPGFRLRKNMSRSINAALNKVGIENKGNLSFLKYVPYTIDELINHLEDQFDSWMNWDNQGSYDPNKWDDNDQSTWRWQLDHIIPQSKLVFESMEEENFKICWSLSNLRPYSAKQNILDGNRRNKEDKDEAARSL